MSHESTSVIPACMRVADADPLRPGERHALTWMRRG